MEETDDLDLFLETWKPSGQLLHTSLPQNLNDPLARQRLLNDGTASGQAARTPFQEGQKAMTQEELVVRRYAFFESSHAKWASEFKDFVLFRGVSPEKLATFIDSFVHSWVDGQKRRQDSQEMLAIKASIRDYDRLYHSGARQFVTNEVDDGVPALLTPAEMRAIFEANSGLIDAFMPDYVDYLGRDGPGCLDDLYVRRGVYMPSVVAAEFRRELHYLSSYSLTVGPVEQFARTWTPATRDNGTPTIFSAPLPAIQDRIVAFAPFIEGMDLSQLEFVVAPPIEEMPLRDDGEYNGIREFSFR